MTDLIKMLEAAGHDERLSDGPLYLKAATTIEDLMQLLEGWQKILEVNTPMAGLCAGKFTLWHVIGPHRHALVVAHNSYDDAALNSILGLLEATRSTLAKHGR